MRWNKHIRDEKIYGRWREEYAKGLRAEIVLEVLEKEFYMSAITLWRIISKKEKAMSENPRIELKEALSFSKWILSHLKAHCIKWEVAGSVRRDSTTVGDLEIVMIPGRRESSLFGSTLNREGFVSAFEKMLTYDGFEGKKSIMSGLPTGRLCRLMGRINKRDTIQVELYMVSESDWGRQLALRTGPADYSHRIAQRWRELGWVGTEDGLRRHSECVESGENRWNCTATNPTKPPVFDSEMEFFKFLNWDYELPQKRV